MVDDDFVSFEHIKIHVKMMDIGYEKRMDTHNQIWINLGAKKRSKNDQKWSNFEEISMTNHQN